jgi:hypothetical protein
MSYFSRKWTQSEEKQMLEHLKTKSIEEISTTVLQEVGLDRHSAF